MKMHITFVQAFAVIWVVFSVAMIVIGMKLAAKPVQPYTPQHMREADAIAARRWKETEKKRAIIGVDKKQKEN